MHHLCYFYHCFYGTKLIHLASRRGWYMAHALPTGPSDIGNPVSTTLNAPLRVSDREAARLLGVSARTVWSMRIDGRLPTVHIGRAKRIPIDALRRFACAAPQTN